MESSDLAAVWLTLKLASVVTVLLLLVGTPIAWWLARTRSRLKGVVGALVALPLVLPPTVIGFYLLIAMGPNGPVGRLTEALGLGMLPFTFPGLVIASVFYSMPFVVQPIQNAFEAIGVPMSNSRTVTTVASLRVSQTAARSALCIRLVLGRAAGYGKPVAAHDLADVGAGEEHGEGTGQGVVFGTLADHEALA